MRARVGSFQHHAFQINSALPADDLPISAPGQHYSVHTPFDAATENREAIRTLAESRVVPNIMVAATFTCARARNSRRGTGGFTVGIMISHGLNELNSLIRSIRGLSGRQLSWRAEFHSAGSPHSP